MIFHSFLLVYQAGVSSQPGEATVSKHYLDWDKNVFGPVAKKASYPSCLADFLSYVERTSWSLLGSPPRSAHQAFFHMNRHKFKPMTSFNLDAPSIKLYVDTTKDPGKTTMAGV